MSDISDAAAVLGRAGGKKGGRSKSAAKLAAARGNLARARASLSPERRREIARAAALARWSNRKQK